MRPWFGWWYLAIAIGFLLLTIRQILAGGYLWGIVIRLIIAAGFALLAVSELRSQRNR